MFKCHHASDTGACWSLPPVWDGTPDVRPSGDASFVGAASGTWSFTAVPSVEPDNWSQYLLMVRARDNSLPFPPGNVQTQFATGSSSMTILWNQPTSWRSVFHRRAQRSALTSIAGR